jgi:hypothetical protein
VVYRQPFYRANRVVYRQPFYRTNRVVVRDRSLAAARPLRRGPPVRPLRWRRRFARFDNGRRSIAASAGRSGATASRPAASGRGRFAN